jgi:PadR family transcriptional regulator
VESTSRTAKSPSGHWLHGFLDLCLLGLLKAHRDYGYELGQRLARAGFDDVPGGTLYPALLRLERQALVAVTWESSASGPRRKYYDLTDTGQRALAEQLADWRHFSRSIDAVTSAETGAVAKTGAVTETEKTGKTEPASGADRGRR